MEGKTGESEPAKEASEGQPEKGAHKPGQLNKGNKEKSPQTRPTQSEKLDNPEERLTTTEPCKTTSKKGAENC